jgi:outer membrane autotransporter protein
MAGIRGESTTLADGSEGVSAGSARGKSIWGRAFGTQNTQGTLSGFSGYKSNTVGLVLGTDADMDGDRTVGIALTYATTKVDQADAATGNNNKITTVGQTVYGTQNFGKAYVDGMFGVSFHSSDNVRQTALSRTATSSSSALEYTGRIGTGYRIAVKDKLTVTPNIQYTVGQYKQKAYTENGADALNLAVNSMSVNRSKLGVGLRVADERTTSKGLVFKPEFSIMASRDFNDAAADLTAAFTGGGATFTTPGQKLSRNSLDVGTGVVFLQGKTGQVGLNYNLQTRESFTGHSFLVQGRLAF